MSGYFDALMRSSGMTIGRSGAAPEQLEPAALDVDVDRTMDTEANAERPAARTSQPPVPSRVSEVAELTVPLWAPGSLARPAHEEPPEAAASSRGPLAAPDEAPGKPQAEPPKADLGQALVRAAMRWVAAGTPQVSPVSPVSPVSSLSNLAQAVPRPEPTVRPAYGHSSSLAAPKPPGGDRDGQSESSIEAPSAPAPPTLSLSKVIAAKPQPFRASLVPPAPLPPAARPVRDDVVEVSIGAIHVRVDAPPAQTVARPALTPAASAPGAARPGPARSALSRRALRRI
jgi:hypothetical protein